MMPCFKKPKSSSFSSRSSSRLSRAGSNEFLTIPNGTHEKWYRDPGLRRLNFGVILMFASAAANGYNCSLINGLLCIRAFYSKIVEGRYYATGLLIAGISLGALPSFIPASYFSDYAGRRMCVGLGSLLMIASSVTQTLSSDNSLFLATRVMLGIGLAFAQTAAPTLATEISHPRHRSTVTNCYQVVWYWGSILSAATTLISFHLSEKIAYTWGGSEYSAWSWRMPCLLQVFFPIIQTVGLFFIPESPRWLVAKNRNDEALFILAKYHANGDLNDDLVRFEYDEILQCIQEEKEHSNFSSFIDTPGNRHRLAICILVGFFTQWCGNGIMSYYLGPLLSQLSIHGEASQMHLNIGLQVWNATFASIGALLVDRYGRRPLWLTSSIGMFFSMVVVLIITSINDIMISYFRFDFMGYNFATVVALFVFYAFYDIAFTPLSIAYPLEILPYHLRTKGLSINLTITFSACCANQYLNPILLNLLQSNLYVVYLALISVMVVIIYFVFPETKGRTLEEIAYVFDGGSDDRKETMALQGIRYARSNSKPLPKIYELNYGNGVHITHISYVNKSISV